MAVIQVVMVFQSGILQNTRQEAPSTRCYIVQAFVATSNANNSLLSSSSIVHSAMELQSQSDQFLCSPPPIPIRTHDRHPGDQKLNTRTTGIGIYLSSACLMLAGSGFSTESRLVVLRTLVTFLCKPSLVDQSIASWE
jgi:hypothetical protein